MKIKYVTVVFSDTSIEAKDAELLPGKRYDYIYNLDEDVQPLDLLVVVVREAYKFVRVVKVITESEKATAFIRARVSL